MSQKPTTAEILEALLGFLEETFAGGSDPITSSTLLADNLIPDSLGFLEVVMFLERRFGAQFKAGDLDGDGFETVASLVELTLNRIGSA